MLFSGLSAILVECLVSVFESPSCFPDVVVLSPAVLDEAAYPMLAERHLVNDLVQGAIDTRSLFLGSCSGS